MELNALMIMSVIAVIGIWGDIIQDIRELKKKKSRNRTLANIFMAMRVFGCVGVVLMGVYLSMKGGV